MKKIQLNEYGLSLGGLAEYYRAQDMDWQEVNRRKKETVSLLRTVVEQELTARQRQVVTMYFYQEMNVVEIAQTLGVNRSTVSRTLNRGLSHIRRYMRYGVQRIR